MMKIIKQAIIPFALVATLLILIFQIAFKTAKSEIKTQKPAETEYTIETFQVGENGWGYSISRNKKLIIRQDIIPALEKQTAFKSEEDAQKTGNLVIEKLKKNQLPTISQSDLERLQIVN